MEPRSSPLRRRVGLSIVLILVLVGAVGFGVYTFVTKGATGWFWGACAVAFFSLMGFLFAAQTGNCFACGEALGKMMSLGLVRCPWCGVYGQAACVAVRELEPDAVRAEPTFAIPIGQGLAMPQVCCVCAQPAERFETVKKTMSTPGLIMSQLHEVSLEVPHCGKCRKGARLDTINRYEVLFEQVKPEFVVVLRVRSHLFYLALCELNPQNLVLLHPV